MIEIAPFIQSLDAIAVTGGTRSQVLVDASFDPLGPAIMWDDSRAFEEAAHLASEFDYQGNPINVFHPLARFKWLVDHHPQEVAAAAAILQPKDFLVCRLTGRCVSDHQSNWMILDQSGLLLTKAVQATGLPLEMLPERVEAHDVVGCVIAHDNLPEAMIGVPVVCGSMDAWCSAVGLGASRRDTAYSLSGTSEVLGIVVEQYRHVDGLLSLPWGSGLWHIGGPSQCGGKTLAWAKGVLGLGDDSLDTLGGGVNTVEHAPIFLPYLDGERTPLWNPKLTGGWYQLDASHDRLSLLYAVVEGVAFNARSIFDAARGTASVPSEIVIGGGLSRSDAWCQIRADALDIPVIRTSADEPGLTGAFMLASVGLGWHGNLTEAGLDIAPEANRFVPNEASRHVMYDRYCRFGSCVEMAVAACATE
ncbi:MAG: carbohydrate kinase [marine bacterium B5-7]|nr:MAG: carbohydrate kinase [marine bacterium B5-7]